MTISFPLNLPDVKSPVRVTLSLVTNVAICRSVYTFAQHKQVHAGKSWAAEITLPPMEREDAEAWQSFLLSLDGPTGTFLLGDPLGKTPQGIATGTPLVNGSSQSGSTLSTRGWTASTIGILKAGDYIQVNQRLYKLKADVDSDSSGIAVLDIWPDIRQAAPTDGTAITTSNCTGLFQLASNQVCLFAADKDRTYDISFSAVEAL